MEIEGHHIEISRSEFELQTADLVSQAETLVVRFLAEIEDIHDLLTERRIIELGLTQSGMRSASAEKGKIRALLCGGATRMPMVLESITRVMGEPPLQYRNPDLLVAEGAALRAHQLTHRMQRESPSRPIAPYNETGSTALSLQEFAMSLSMRESEPPPSFALVRVDSQSSPLLNLFSLLITNPGVVYQFEKQLADSASPARSQADLSLTTARLAHLRLDAAVPGRVVVNQVFELAVAVRKRTSSILAERDLTRVQSADVQLRWPAGRHHVTLRIHLSAPDCVIQGADSQSFELDADEDSPVCYFQLVPRKLGEINIVVRVYQSENTLGSARVQTVASEQAVGSMHLAVTSYPFAVSLPVPDHLAYDPVRLQAFLSAKVELPQFCFALERRLRRCYAYRDLKGSADSEKVMDLIQRADTNEELGKIIFHLIRFWIEDRNYSPQVLRKHGLHQDLNVFCFELQEQGDPDRMAVVADRLREILSR
jgi:hypothetical protein